MKKKKKREIHKKTVKSFILKTDKPSELFDFKLMF